MRTKCFEHLVIYTLQEHLLRSGSKKTHKAKKSHELPSTEPKTPKNPKSLKKVSREEFGTPRAWTPKKSKKIPNFLAFRTFLDFFGVRARGVPNSSRETFLRLFGFFGVFGSVDGRGDLNTKPKNCTNSTKELSEQFGGGYRSLPIKTRALRQIAPEVHPNVRQNLCHTVSLWYLFCPQLGMRKPGPDRNP